MSKPANQLDGAKVLVWAWSGATPFGVVRDSLGTVIDEIYGLAICRYASAGVVYRFSCNHHWEVVQDADYVSVDEAKYHLPTKYKMVPVTWITYEESLR